MEQEYKRVIKYFQKVRERLNCIYIWPTHSPTWQQLYLSTAALYCIWQVWNSFCRNIILLSCKGTISRAGRNVAARSQNNDWSRVAYEAKRYAKGKSITPTGRINYRRHEPTWGDVSFLLNAIPGLNTSNMTELMLGFGVSLAGPEHLQIVRNACAHIDKESMADVRSISSYYVGKSLKHPVEIIWWLAPSNKTDAIFTWLDDLEIIANLVTE